MRIDRGEAWPGRLVRYPRGGCRRARTPTLPDDPGGHAGDPDRDSDKTDRAEQPEAHRVGTRPYGPATGLLRYGSPGREQEHARDQRSQRHESARRGARTLAVPDVHACWTKHRGASRGN